MIPSTYQSVNVLQIARGTQTVEQLSDTLELEVERLEPEGRPAIGAVLATGIIKPTAFDQYVTASADSYNVSCESLVLYGGGVLWSLEFFFLSQQGRF